jgi:hypothetical protein
MKIWITCHVVDYEGGFDISYHKTEEGAEKARQLLIKKEKESIRSCFSKPFGPGEKEKHKEMLSNRFWNEFVKYSVEVVE